MKSNLLKAALLASAAALALGAAPANAAPVLSGYVDAWGALGSTSYSETEKYYDDGDYEGLNHYHGNNDASAFGGDGRADMQWDSGFGIQLDAQGSDEKLNSYDYDRQSNNIAAHVYQRSDDMLWGGFGSFGSSGEARWGTIGAEFQKYCDQWTFYGQVSWSGGAGGYSSQEGLDSWNFNAQARYFINSHFMLTAGVGYDTYSYSYNEDDDYYHYSGHLHNWNWTLRAEYLFSDLPVSIFGEYDGSRTPFNESYTYDYGYDEELDSGRDTSNLFMIGVRLFLNQQDLMTNDRTGASLEDLNPWTGKLAAGLAYGEGD